MKFFTNNPIFLTAEMPNIDISNVTGGVKNISEAIYNYGIAIVVMGVFFVVFLILIIIMLFNNIRMSRQIMDGKADTDKQREDVITKLIDSALEAKNTDMSVAISKEIHDSISPISKQLEELSSEVHKNDHHHNDDEEEDYHKDIVGAYIDISMAFKDISRKTLTELNCDRIAIYVFHNGNTSIYGLPFFKMSCIHEWTKHGAHTLRGKSHADIPLHLFDDFIENLYKHGIYKSENIDNVIEEDTSIKDFLALSDTKAMYLIAVKNTDDALVGFVAAEFAEIESFESNPNRDKYIMQVLDHMVANIAPIIGNKYIYRKH